MLTPTMTVLLVFHIIIVAIMIGLILLQKSECGALGMGGGNFMTARGTANLLTRSTAVLATLFFITTLVLAILFKGSLQKSSILDKGDDTKPAITTPATSPEAPMPAAPAPSN